ncbi:MAG: hypothetical protein IT426_04995 [Pirellulales bacterium]|nr:hypothetical protein [Pirellulales bacterium]
MPRSASIFRHARMLLRIGTVRLVFEKTVRFQPRHAQEEEIIQLAGRQIGMNRTIFRDFGELRPN